MAKIPTQKTVETIKHDDAKRKNIPTAEFQSVMKEEEQNPIRIAYQRRNRDLDPQLVWRGKDEQDWSDLVVQAPPLYIQEKVHPKALIDDLQRHTEEGEGKKSGIQRDLFADFNGLPDENAKTEFYQHDAHWSNRMILGDSLQVMASLAEREGLRGKVQCIYIDPPYGIKFNSNFQWSTTSRDVKDGNVEHITREPEQVKAFRDTWRDGIHSYLTYLRDRLTVARDLLTDSGSIFVQIGDENVHRVRALMDEVFGDENFISQISYVTTGGLASDTLSRAGDYILWFAKKNENLKFRDIVQPKKSPDDSSKSKYDQFETENGFRLTLTQAKILISDDELTKGRIFRIDNIISQGCSENTISVFHFRGSNFDSGVNNHWKTNPETGMPRLGMSERISISSQGKLGYIRYFSDFPVVQLTNIWTDIGGSVQSRSDPKIYVVQTGTSLIERCLLMATDPGDLVLDPTCGSGTTAYVAEQWGRRWITIDTSRVALALARARIMGARYPYYLLADSPEGQLMEAKITATAPSTSPTRNNIRQGFVYQRVPHVTLKSIANNAEIDVIWEDFQTKLEPLRKQLNTVLGKTWEEWEIPRDADAKWPEPAGKLHGQWWELRIARQKKIDASIAAKAESEYLYDKPYEDNKKIRVAGPFTVDSLSPHRVLGVDENDELIDELAKSEMAKVNGERIPMDFARMILENLKTSGVQQAHKEDKITFTSLTPWPGDLVCAEGRYIEGGKETGKEKRAAIFIGPEFGTVSRPDLVQAAREAGDAGFDVLITCAFNYDAHSTEFSKLGRIQVLKARMNADLHMADDLKNTGKGNLFVIFGEPDIEIHYCDKGYIRMQVHGVEVFHPDTGEVRSDGPDGIACWFIDADYNEESFFVRHAYFLGANDPYKALKTTLKAQIHEEAWETLHSAISRPFKPPASGRIAVKVINHLGDEVMKVFRVL
ncbi:MAG: site-specific DNA-methyltransferase [Candidatus Aminicenantes bacterium]|nr:site-specific DNA-methyltransferase [Candidatus Aminicenantes bacterium]